MNDLAATFHDSSRLMLAFARVVRNYALRVHSDPLAGRGPYGGCCQTNLSGCLCTEPVFMHPIYRIYVAVSLHMSRFFCTFIA